MINISNYNIFINGMSKDNYLQSLADSDFKDIIQRTLCIDSQRSSTEELLSVAQKHYNNIQMLTTQDITSNT